MMGSDSDIAAVTERASDEEQWRVIRLVCRRYRGGLLTGEEAKAMLEMLGLVSPGYVWISPPSSDGHRRKISLQEYEAKQQKSIPLPRTAGVKRPKIDHEPEVAVAIDLLRAGIPYPEVGMTT